MTVQRDPDAILAAWLDEGPDRLPEPTRRAIAVTTRTDPSDAARSGVPWRYPTMNGTPRLALGAVAIVAVALGGLYLSGGPPSGGVGGPRRSPTVASSLRRATRRPAAPARTHNLHGLGGWRLGRVHGGPLEDRCRRPRNSYPVD